MPISRVPAPRRARDPRSSGVTARHLQMTGSLPSRAPPPRSHTIRSPDSEPPSGEERAMMGSLVTGAAVTGLRRRTTVLTAAGAVQTARGRAQSPLGAPHLHAAALM